VSNLPGSAQLLVYNSAQLLKNKPRNIEHMDMQSLIDEMVALLQKIKAGNATLGELESFAAAAAQLNERAIILKYKAYEAKVYEKPFELAEANTPAAAAVQTSAATGIVSANTTETSISEPVNETEDMSFDLFSIDDQEAEIEIETEELVTPEEPIDTFKENTTFGFSDSAPDAAPEPVFEQASVAPIHATPMEAPATEDALSNSQGEHPIYAKIVTDDNSLAARLLNVPLASLQGAFGFNERLQIIQELFDGNADAYNDAIQVLDQQPNKAHARAVASGFAYQFGWDENNHTALDFIQKVERRYA
jgi:hypothetical protein